MLLETLFSRKTKTRSFGSLIFLTLCFLLCLNYLTAADDSSQDCTEQWTQIDINSKEEWITVGDVSITEGEEGKVFEFERTNPTLTGEIGGAVWNTADFSHKRGIKITFSPTIHVDNSYFGNTKYPYGFAIVFTSSSIENLIGKKGDGNGYEGIMNAVAFEFDFVKHSSKGDYKNPHFAIHSNITGAVSASNVGCGNLCKTELINFYDSGSDNYVKNIIFEIEIVGKKVTVKSNHGVLLKETDLGEFQELLDQDDIHIGITASMTQEKKVTISNFKVSEVSTKEKGELTVKTVSKSFTAGYPVSLYYSIKSSCGKSLKIYTSEYTSDDFELIVNDKVQVPDSKTFDSSSTEIKIVLTETKVDTYTALVRFKGSYSTPTQFFITEGNVQRYEICDDQVDSDYKIIKDKIQQTKDYFYVDVCSYDQFKNPKPNSVSSLDQLKLFYPNMVVQENVEELQFSEDKKKLKFIVPIGTFGVYQIFNVNFTNFPIRYFNLTPEAISPEKSDVSILYGMNIIKDSSSSISLKVLLKDNYGRVIPKYLLESMKCDFSKTTITGISNPNIKTEFLDNDNVILTVSSISSVGRYLFVPKVFCEGIPETTLSCNVDENTNENLCAFYKEDTSASLSMVQLYSDFTGEYNIYSQNTDTPLLVSLNENKNSKITELILVDQYQNIYYGSSAPSVSAKFDDLSLDVVKVGHLYGLHLPSGTSRSDFNPNGKHSLTLTLDSSTITVTIRMYNLDNFMSGLIQNPSSTVSYKVFYKQNSKTIKASSNVLLFDLFEFYQGSGFGDGSSLDPNKVELYIEGERYVKTSDGVLFNKYGPFISVSTNKLKKVGDYLIQLDYNSEQVVLLTVTVIPDDVMYALGNETGHQLTESSLSIGAGEIKRLTILDKYGNVLINNQLFTAFSKIQISSDGENIKVKPTYNGVISIKNEGRTKEELTLRLPNTKIYKIVSNEVSTITDIDPLQSFGLLTTKVPAQDKENDNTIFPPSIIKPKYPVQVTLYLKDSYGNSIEDSLENSNINIYLKNKNLKQVIELGTTTKQSSKAGIVYESSVLSEGDYDVKIFVNNYPVECRACHFRVLSLKSLDNKNIKLSLLGNKRKIPVLTSENNPQIISKKQNLIFFFQFFDIYGNSRAASKTYSLYLTGADKRIGLCSYGNSEEERSMYKICSDQEKIFNDAKEGIYSLKIEDIIFYFLLTSKETDSSDNTPKMENSFIVQNDTTVYGKTDTPGSFILDLRNKNKFRLSNIDVTKISIEGNENVNSKAVLGPEPGLVTVFLMGKEPGEYTLSINYNSLPIVGKNIKFICGCGSIKGLKYNSIASLDDGHYVLFDALDHLGNVCKTKYSWNEFDEEESYGKMIIKANKLNDDNELYKTKTYYNHLTGQLCLKLDLHVSGSVTLSSSLITFDEDKNSKDIIIPSKVIDKDHFYVRLDSNNKEVKIDLLGYNYESISKETLKKEDFDLVTLRQVNDDLVLYGKNYTVANDFSISYAKTQLDSAGQYIFVVYYKDEELFCENCSYDNTMSNIQFSMTVVSHKEGENYIEDDPSYFNKLYKSNFAFFKVNLFSDNKNLILLSSMTDVSISLQTNSKTISTNTELGSDGNIYVYLTEDGRNTFLGLEPLTEITLKIGEYSIKYTLLNGYTKQIKSYEKCTEGSEINIINLQDSYVTRASDILTIGFNLDGCFNEQEIIQDSSAFKISINGEYKDIKVIPTDLYGSYLALISVTKSFKEPVDAYLIFDNKSTSPVFKLFVLPGYHIYTMVLQKDDSLPVPSTNKQFAYFSLILYDVNMNLISNVGRNLFLNDNHGIIVKDSNGNSLPYKVSFDEESNAMKYQVPINGNGLFTVTKNSSEVCKFNINPTVYSENNFASLSLDQNKYNFQFSLRDNFYKTVSGVINDKVTFKYFTINPITEEIFEKVLTPEILSNNNFEIILPNNYPKYHVYGFIPFIGFREQICPSCLIENPLTDYVYSVHGNLYLPHNMAKEINLIKNIDYPVFIYSSKEALTITPTTGSNTNKNLSKELINNSLLNVYVFAYESNEPLTSATIEIQGTSETKTLSLQMTDYETIVFSKDKLPSITERYGYNSFLHNSGDNKNINFFMEIRDDTKKLISGDLSLYLDDTTLGFKKINVFNAMYGGIYYVTISPTKKVSLEYSLKYSSKEASENDILYNTIFLESLSSFPTSMVLNNKQQLDTNIIKYDIIATNSNSEEICDERLNIYSDDKKKLQYKQIFNEEGSCKLLLQFTGDLNLTSNIGIEKLVSELSNNNNNLYSINQHYSSLTVSPNTFDEERSIDITFNEMSPVNRVYGNDEITINKKLYVFKYYTPLKYDLVSVHTGLYSSSYSFSSVKLGLSRSNSYILVGTLVNNNIPPKFVSFNSKNDVTPFKFSLSKVNNNKVSTKVTNLSSSRSSINPLELSYPFYFELEVKNSNDESLDIDLTSQSEKIEAEIQVRGLGESDIVYEIPLIVKQYNDKKVLIELDKTNLDKFIHLPSAVHLNYYYLEITYDYKSTPIKFYSYLTIKNNNQQNPDNNVYYDYYDDEVPSNDLALKIGNSQDIFVPSNTDTVLNLCLVNTKTNQIINQHLDRKKLTIDDTATCKFSYDNSYIGCVSITANCDLPSNSVDVAYSYNGTSLKYLYFTPFPSSNLVFSLKSDEEYEVETTEDIDVQFQMKSGDSSISEKIDMNYFKVYINGEKITNNIKDSLNNNIRIKIHGQSTSIPKKKLIMIVYEDGRNQKSLVLEKPVSISIKQPDYTFSGYNFRAQVPLDIKVGDKIYFYLIVKDSSHSCYYGDKSKLNSIGASIALSSREKISSGQVVPQLLEGIDQCEYVYKLEFENTCNVAGDYKIDLFDGDNTIRIQGGSNLMIYIGQKDLDATKCILTGSSNVKAGEKFELNFSGSDSLGNKLNYHDIIDYFDIQIIDKDTSEMIDFDKKISVATSNDKLILALIIDKYGAYNVKLIYKDNQLTGYQGTQKITVSFGECSHTEPEPRFVELDGRADLYYLGETVTVSIQCKDTLGNKITTRGNEIFLATVKIPEKDYKLPYEQNFISGQYYFTFSPSEVGRYNIIITLNGKSYGSVMNFDVKSYNYSLYMCMDKKQVSDLAKCSTSNYQKLITSILGEENICSDSEKEGKLFKCSTKEEGETLQCVANTNECNCTGTDWNGFCYTDTVNPIQLVKENQNKVSCISKLKAQDPDTEYFLCDDGTCRTNISECSTKFECPIGFKSCGNKCILMSIECKLNNECQEDEVLCWDMSCASSYDLCPTRITCPLDKVLCPDGSCQEIGHCAQPIKRKCDSEDEYQCSDFSCVKNKNDCPKNIICPLGKSLCENNECQDSCQDVIVPKDQYRCPNGDYVESSQLCPTDMYSPPNYIKCPNGAIAKSLDDCKYTQGDFKMSCPVTKPVLCPDFECVATANECSTKIPTCPPHKPYQCWNNECRSSPDLCPTKIVCPPNSPVLCSNGLCATSISGCYDKKMIKCPDYRCFDGTCVKSMELCPTFSYCGKDTVKCWNGACVSKVEDCPSSDLEDCPANFPYRCPDGSCRPEQKSCSSITVCPSHLPVKCFDNSCRAHINECPAYQSCGENKVSCPDGTCASSREECNTVVSCTNDKPFLCYDNSCKKELSECPEPPKCGKNEVLCPNGSCMSYRQNCKIFDPCEASSPIRCESNTCYSNFVKCSNLGNRCPTGYITCSNGDCKTSEYLCDKKLCPKNRPYLCDEGVCVHDRALCDNSTNGCPYNTPYKCPDGTCVSSQSKCAKSFSCDKNLKACPDGSCIEKTEECPLINGCYSDRPFKCADGTCINLKTSTCSKVLCPVRTPIKCPNGHCVSQSSECSYDLRTNETEDCGAGMIMCEDGRCVISSEYCRPSFECENGYTYCNDGSCRVSESLCPKNVKCPESRPFRCPEHYCVKNETDCQESFVCPKGYTRCSTNGACYRQTIDDCPASPKVKTGCPLSSQVKCSNGRCLASKDACMKASNACPDDSKPFLCPNGKCTDDLSNCDDTKCSKDFCSSGKCVAKTNKAKRTQCSNEIGCPLYKPYRCSNGECVTNFNKCSITSFNSGGQIISNLACDDSKPYLCDDQTCVSDYTFCKASLPCEQPNQKCANGFCIGEKDKCEDYKTLCPATNPIKCKSGTCVSNIIDCVENKKPTCENGEFYCTRLAKCVKRKMDCLIYYDNIIKVNLNRRLFDSFDDRKSLISFVEGEEDPEEEEHIDEPTGTICYDGTIATPGDKCPIVPACGIGQYRCENGGCAYDIENCYVDKEYQCEEGQMKCPDGMCHKNCEEVAYHGCLVGQYQCSNGMCVEDKYECIGYSMCDPQTPYRCIDSTCRSSPLECPVIERLGTVKNITYTYNKLNKIQFSFAFDTNSRTIGKIEIPGSGLDIKGKYSNLYLEEVSSSLLYGSHLYNNSADFLFDVSNSINGSEGVLNFENSVMSPVFKFYSKEKSISFKLDGIITLSHNTYSTSGLNYSDYCLAKLKGFDVEKDVLVGDKKDQHWECVERQTEDEQEEFRLNGFGVYAVILNPYRQKKNYLGDIGENSFFLKNIQSILIVLACVVVFLALVFYIFMRVSRYREKYHENRKKIELLQQQREEYENMTTDVFGQTLGDNILGLVYKTNPCYMVSEENKGKSGSLEEEIENLQIQCKNVENQNQRLQEKIDEMNEKYKMLTNTVENMAK